MEGESLVTKASTCFLSYPIRSNLHRLRGALKDLNIEILGDDFLTEKARGLQQITEYIQQADFVCAVLPAKTSLLNVMFEIGLARGLGKKILCFAEPSTEIPFALRELTLATTSLANSNAIQFRLEAFLDKYFEQGTRSGIEKRISDKIERSREGQPRIVMHDVAASRQAPEEAPPPQRLPATDFAERVYRLFTEAGVQTVREPGPGPRPDMVLWIEDLDSILGNPIVVESKATPLRAPDLRAAELQLRGFIKAAGAYSGILVHDWKSPRARTGRSGRPFILEISIDELERLVQERRLPEGLREKAMELAKGGK